MKERIVNRRTSWYVINVKARRQQNESHYVDAFEAIATNDPLVEVGRVSNRYMSIKSLSKSEILTNAGHPTWMQLTVVAYTIIDENAFYNRRSKEDVTMEWDSDIVANKKETDLIVIPSVHKVVMKHNSDITLNYVVEYLEGALNSIESEGFDVTTVKDQETIDKIRHANKLISMKANISYSNPGHGNTFNGLFDRKMQASNLISAEISLQGSSDHPLSKEADGIVDAILNISEQNGAVEAVVQNGESHLSQEKIITSEHPFIMRLPQIIGSVCSTLYNELKTRYGNH